MRSVKQRRLAGALLATALSAGAPALPAQGYPERPVRMIVPYSAGGATDIVSRILAQKLPEVLGQQVIVDNRPGAGSLIGTDIAAKAPPDGYTLLSIGSPHVILPHLHKKLPYDALKDFAPIMQFGDQPYALTVHPSLGVSTVKELIALAQKQPGKINYASSGNGGAQHLFAAMFVSMAKIDMVHIPYKGSGPARADLLGGQVKVGCLGIVSVLSNHKAGQVRIIAVTSAKRSHEVPDVPSIAETVPGYDASLWQGLLAPRATPPAVISRIQRDVTKLLQMPDVQGAFERAGTYTVATDPKAFGELLRIEFDKWGKVVREINLQVD
ncbi:MAG: Bug family tripartite tricarboxylate transporter substrate binding protein [Burkholderiales bacterium]